MHKKPTYWKPIHVCAQFANIDDIFFNNLTLQGYYAIGHEQDPIPFFWIAADPYHKNLD